MAKLQDINLLDLGHAIQLAGAVYMGNGKLYLTMFPDERGTLDAGLAGAQFIPRGSDRDEPDVVDVDILDMGQDDWAKLMRQTDILEVEVLVKDDTGIGKAIVRKSQRQIEQGVSWRVYKRDGYRCRYCAADDVPLTVDHLVLWEDGGPSTVENLVSACRKCNKTRGNTQYSQWLAHPYYLKVSRNLSEETRLANHQLIETLDRIPRTPHKRSR